MKCKFCNSKSLYKIGSYKGYQRYKCNDCYKSFTEGITSKTGRKPLGEKPLTNAEKQARFRDKKKGKES
jgi:transposase-like protein